MSEGIREDILAYMRKETAKHAKDWPGRECWLCTWWFKFHIEHKTPAVRRELERMEKEGLVTSDRQQSNNTKWKLAEVST